MQGEGTAAALAERLQREPSLQPLGAEVFEYGLFELADAAAVRCAAKIEPEQLRAAEERACWTTRALAGETMSEPFVAGRLPYWIVDDGERIGTVAFAVLPGACIEISSVFVRPKYRRQGWASRVLCALREAAFEVGFKRTTLQVEWNNQEALQFYCAQGMWVGGWKNAIELYFASDQPRWHVEVCGAEARFKVKGRVAAVAHKKGALLAWTLKKTAELLKQPLEQTAALQLALHGWPIIRSEKLWREQVYKGWSDGGSFEGFALRLRQLERHIRRKHWNLPEQRNPSFADLPKISAARAVIDKLEVTLSDGTELVIPFEALGVASELRSVSVNEEEVVTTLQSGTPLIYNIDYLLFLTQSPQHLAKAAELTRLQGAAG